MQSKNYREGIALFNQHSFFEAHEVLEDVWRAAPEPERKFLQGLIQVAVALHHHSRGNLVGCRSLLDRARRNLATYPAEYGGVDLGGLLDSVDRWREALHQGSPAPPLPQLRMAQ
jgi:predicted metal-dependent hydrolase